MANEKALEILKEMIADPKAEEMIRNTETAHTTEAKISVLAEAAGKLGYDITAAEIREVIEKEEARKKAKTDKTISDFEALEDEALDGVAGGKQNPKQEGVYFLHIVGKIYGCYWDFREDECTSLEACDSETILYYNCSVSYHPDRDY